MRCAKCGVLGQFFDAPENPIRGDIDDRGAEISTSAQRGRAGDLASKHKHAGATVTEEN